MSSMSSHSNIEMKSLSSSAPAPIKEIKIPQTNVSQPQEYDVKKETNSNIRYLMSYYGY